MADTVTVGKPYFEALLRRADFHTKTQLYGQPDPVNVTISKVEYDSLLRNTREYEQLKSALFQGGITAETLDLLISGSSGNDHRKDSGIAMDTWDHDIKDHPAAFSRPEEVFSAATFTSNAPVPFRGASWRNGSGQTNLDFRPSNGGSLQSPQAHLRVPGFQRQTSIGNGESSWDDEDYSFTETACHTSAGPTHSVQAGGNRSIFFHGLSELTTHKDLVSAITGGKLLDIHLRQDRTASVSFFSPDAAAGFLAWAKRNDVYINSKRVEVKWADRQFTLNNHIANKIINNGATRNVIIRGAHGKLTEREIRDDMEHIHNLVIVDVHFRNGDAYVSMNSVHNALFARTCMMSRSTYKGNKVDFYPDECDVPLPERRHVPKTSAPEPVKRKALGNRFDLLNMDGTENGSDEENHEPVDDSDDDETLGARSNFGVSLNFLESESVA